MRRAVNPWVWVSALAGLLYLAYKGATTTQTGISIVSAVSPGAWLTLGNAPLYVNYINQIEAQYGIPANLLARIAFQESNFNPAAVNASSGALGMFQMLPRYFPGVGANWQDDAATAANYLRQLYQQFGDWQLAVAAYNDGPGNIQKFLAGTHPLPAETQNYVAKVFADVPIAGALVQTYA